MKKKIIKVAIYSFLGTLLFNGCDNSPKDNRENITSTDDILTSLMKENKIIKEDNNISIKNSSNKLSVRGKIINRLEKLVSSYKENEYKDDDERVIGTLDVDKVNIADLEEIVAEAEKEKSKIEKEIEILIEDKPKDKQIEDNRTEVAINQNIKVKYGDTLSSLALDYYDNASKYTKIYEANRDKIKEDYIIYTGMTLLIP